MSALSYPGFNFNITHTHAGARCGELTTPHGVLQTPCFIFCATRATLKGLTMQQVKQAGADIVLSNTYHLMLVPGAEMVACHGGLHALSKWNGPMLTDSGGYQVFSMQHGSMADEIKGTARPGAKKTLTGITERGAKFRSYVDGAHWLLTPEESVRLQRMLGPDIMVSFDECTANHDGYEYTARSLQRTHRWELRCLREFENSAGMTLGEDFIDESTGKPWQAPQQAMYGVQQGGIYANLRDEAGAFLREQPFFGQAIGGCMGKTKEEMHAVVRHAATSLHPGRPTHLLGIGGISDFFNGIHVGIDTFDCVHPTRLARHGGMLVQPSHHGGKEHLNLLNTRFKKDMAPLGEYASAEVAQAVSSTLGPSPSAEYTRAYVHYLLKVNESLAGIILTQHNIHLMMQLVHSVRAGIQGGTLASVQKTWLG